MSARGQPADRADGSDTAGRNTSDLVSAAHALRPTLAERAAEGERARRVPEDLAGRLAAEGFYRMLVPARHGGGEVHPWTFVEVLEALGRGDGAPAWTVMTGATTGLLAAYLPPATAGALFGRSETVPAGVFAPAGRARPVDGGFRLSGRWAWNSGVDNSTVRLAGALVMEGDAPRLLPTGQPELRSFFLEPEQSRVLDTWDTSGLRGTGSHDLVVEDVFVPSDRTTCVLVDPPLEPGPLYRFSLFGLLALGVSAVGLGIARAALDEIVRLASEKRSGRKVLADVEATQLDVAQAEGELAAARALMQVEVEAAWGSAELDDGRRARLRLAATHAAWASTRAVDAAYHLAGGASVYSRSPLQRAFRDIHTLTQHVMVNRMSLKPVGRILLGRPTDVSQL